MHAARAVTGFAGTTSPNRRCRVFNQENPGKASIPGHMGKRHGMARQECVKDDVVSGCWVGGWRSVWESGINAARCLSFS